MPRRPRKPPSPIADEHRVVIPTRQAVLDYLTAVTPKTFEGIASALGVDDDERRQALRRRIKAMQRDGQIVLNRQRRYGVTNKMDLYRGTVIGHHDGYGFLNIDDESDDLYLSPHEMRRLLHGDRIIAHLLDVDARGRREGAVVEILERANQQVAGRYFEEANIAFVNPENKRIHQDVLIPSPPAGLVAGHYVVAEITRQPEMHAPPIGKIIRVLGAPDTAEIAVQVALHTYDIPAAWTEAVSAEVAEYRDTPSANPLERREDLRHLPFVTIDGEDARDFDDAVYAEAEGRGFRLYVAIADVSHYVRSGSAIDKEALRRGNSVYFPRYVVPMLPEMLSNDLCSLKPHTDRLCLVVRLTVNQQGRVTDSRFFEGVIHSAARLTYSNVNHMVVTQDPKLGKQYQAILPHLKTLYAVYGKLRKQRKKRGLLDFDAVECRFEFNETHRVIGIHALKRNDAHRLIEECMLAANVATAEFLLEHKMPALYRVHESPEAEKLKALRGFLAELGLSLGGGDKTAARDYARLIDQVADRHDANLIETVLLRSMRLANYRENNLGHFGLAFPAYTHFTSPIRRYADLVVHRSVRHLIRHRRARGFRYSSEDLHDIANHCSVTDRRAEEAARSVVQWYKCHFMRSRIGEVFHGVISGVTSFGLFATLHENYAEGLIHITALPADYYHYDAVGHRLRGERHGRCFRLGDRITVRVVRVDMDDKKIDFELEG